MAQFDYLFYAFYTTSGVGTAGLTVTCDVRDSSGNLLVNNQSATGVGGGVYKYLYSSNNKDDFIAVFKTATSVDVKQIMSQSTETISTKVWDEKLTNATFNTALSAGQRLRLLASNVIYSSTLPDQSTALSNTIVLDTGADSTDGAYDPALIAITSGTGNGQSRLILQYAGATRNAVVDRDWKIQPVAGDEFVILADPGREHVNEGLIRAGTSNTVRLNANASTDNNAYNGQIIFIRSGHGSDQARKVIAYNGLTQTATVDVDWAVIPNTTSAYVMLPTGAFDEADLVDYVWNNATRELTYYPSSTSIAVSSSQAALIAQGYLVIRTFFTFEQPATSTLVDDLTTADDIIFAVKRAAEPDALSYVYMTQNDGLTIVNQQAYPVPGDGSVVVTGSSGSWTITLTLEQDATSLLYDYAGQAFDAEIKAIFGSVSKTVWAGSCFITQGVIHTL